MEHQISLLGNMLYPFAFPRATDECLLCMTWDVILRLWVFDNLRGDKCNHIMFNFAFTLLKAWRISYDWGHLFCELSGLIMCSFFIGLLVLIWDLSWESLYRLQVIVIYDLICKYFSHFCHLAFYFTTVAFCRAKFLFLCNPTDFFLIIN